MTSYAVQVDGLAEAVEARGADIVIGLMERLEALAGSGSTRYDPEDGSIHLEFPATEGDADGPSFAHISHLVQSYGAAIERPLAVGMIHRTLTDQSE